MFHLLCRLALGLLASYSIIRWSVSIRLFMNARSHCHYFRQESLYSENAIVSPKSLYAFKSALNSGTLSIISGFPECALQSNPKRVILFVLCHAGSGCTRPETPVVRVSNQELVTPARLENILLDKKA